MVSVTILPRVREFSRADPGSASCWVVDPDVPSITAWELHDGEYVEAASVVGDDAFVPDAPFAVRLVPADQVRSPPLAPD